MSGWDFEGEFTWDEDEGVESEQAKSVLNRWRVLNLMRPPGMTHAFYRILSVIVQNIPPGKELWKGRRQLAEEADVSLRIVVKFYQWAYDKKVNLMGRKKGRRGFSDKVRPNYRAWVDHAVPTVQRMTDLERQAKAAGYLEAFALAIGKDGMWVRRFRQSLGSVESSLPSEQNTAPQGKNLTTPSEESTPPLVQKVHPRSEVLTRSSKQKEKQALENGPAVEQAQGRASRSSSPSQRPKDDKPKSKSATRAEGKQREAVRLYFEREAAMGQGLRTFEHWDKWFPPGYDRGMLREVYDEVTRKVNGGVNGD